MTYSFLSPHLQGHAEAVKQYFKTQRGIGSFKIEEAVSSDVPYRHTLVAPTKDFHYLCVEVSEQAYSSALDATVLYYRGKSLPVKLYVAIPKGLSNSDLQTQLRQARDTGVGVIEVDLNGCDIIQEATSQSLAGLRSPNLQEYPAKYRAPLSDAAHTFRNGSPSKGCSEVYDEIEALSRRIALKTQAKSWWKIPPKVKLNTGPWAKVIEEMMEKLNYSKCPPKLKKTLLARVLGITPHRNDTGHKINTKAARIKRDTQLRTRFEAATDLLQDLIEASKPLYV